MYEMEEIKEKVILVGVETGGDEPAETSLDELAELARTAGAEVAGRLIQTRESIHPGTYIGKGKLLELKDLLWETDATGIICDDELTSAQLGSLEAELSCKVIDRTLLILDIFAARAVSGEGKIQRLSWLSSDTGRQGWQDSGNPCPVWAAASARGGRERRSWRWTGVSSANASAD